MQTTTTILTAPEGSYALGATWVWACLEIA